MADYNSIAKKFAASEERLFTLLDELAKVRRDFKSGGYKDQEIAARGEQLFDDARKEQQTAQKLRDQMAAMHEDHWRKEYQRQIDAARKALVPLARAWLIAHKALGDRRICAVFLQHQITVEMAADLEQQVSRETHEIPIDAPPASFALERAEDEVELCNVPSLSIAAVGRK
jgi:hypothetical protein